MTNLWLHVCVFVVLIIMHSGVRLGRKVYLVDMAGAENRAMYVAVSNTLVGIAMLLFGSIGFLTAMIGLEAIILLLSLSAFYGVLMAIKLQEIE